MRRFAQGAAAAFSMSDPSRTRPSSGLPIDGRTVVKAGCFKSLTMWLLTTSAEIRTELSQTLPKIGREALISGRNQRDDQMFIWIE